MFTEFATDTPLPRPDEASFNVSEAATFAIDQAIIDRNPLGDDFTVPTRFLSKVAFNDQEVPPEMKQALRRSIDSDSRHIRTNDSGIEFLSTAIDHPTLAIPSLASVILGKSNVAAETRERALEHVNPFLEVIFSAMKMRGGVRIKEVEPFLRAAGFELTMIESDGVLVALRNDSRIQQDSRNVLVLADRLGYLSDPDQYGESELLSSVDQALKKVELDEQMAFHYEALVQVVRNSGMSLADYTEDDISMAIRSNPDVKQLEGDNQFAYLGVQERELEDYLESVNPRPESPQSEVVVVANDLNQMMKKVLPRRRPPTKGGKGRKRVHYKRIREY